MELPILIEAADMIEALTAQAAVPDMERTPDEEITPEVWSFVQSQFVRPTTDRSFYTFVALLVTRHRAQLSAMQERLEKAEEYWKAAENETTRLLVLLNTTEARVAELEARKPQWTALLEKYDAARENQKDHGPDIGIVVMANYGELALQYLRAALHQQDGGENAERS